MGNGPVLYKNVVSDVLWKVTYLSSRKNENFFVYIQMRVTLKRVSLKQNKISLEADSKELLDGVRIDLNR